MNSLTDLANSLELSRLDARLVKKRNDELETALNRMVTLVENIEADSEGEWPKPDAGCIECTCGTVPDKYNTGLCARHEAQRLLGML